jgi:hypothetical protein
LRLGAVIQAESIGGRFRPGAVNEALQQRTFQSSHAST